MLDVRKLIRKSEKDVLLVIPTLNEESAIGKIIKEIPKNFDVLIVDGGSKDRTVEIARNNRIPIIHQKFGKGKGCGVRTGMEEFLKRRQTTLCIIDGDGSNDPRELIKMNKLIEMGKAEVVLGSRTMGRREPDAMSSLTRTSNIFASHLLSVRFFKSFTDVQTGYWSFSRPTVEKIYPKLTAKGFEIEMDIFIKCNKYGIDCLEIPVRYRKREGNSKFSPSLRLKSLHYLMYYFIYSLI
jgi:dolichol-phosphate mannosyltransferase